jgi:hypothetical protein
MNHLGRATSINFSLDSQNNLSHDRKQTFKSLHDATTYYNALEYIIPITTLTNTYPKPSQWKTGTLSLRSVARPVVAPHPVRLSSEARVLSMPLNEVEVSPFTRFTRQKYPH